MASVYRMLHVFTVGTSVLRNAAARAGSDPHLAPHASVLRSWAQASVDSSEDLEAGKSAVPGSPVFRDVLGAVAASPRSMSAELNAFLGLLDGLGEGSFEHRVYLLSTDSGAGWFSARVLEEFLKPMSSGIPGAYLSGGGLHRVVGASSVRVAWLGRDFGKGLVNLLAEVKRAVSREAGWADEVLFNLTGGFKPEAGFLALAAGLMGVNRLYYIHESMGRVVELPVIPLKVADHVEQILRRAAAGQLGEEDYRLLRGLKILKPWEKEAAWLSEVARVLLT